MANPVLQLVKNYLNINITHCDHIVGQKVCKIEIAKWIMAQFHVELIVAAALLWYTDTSQSLGWYPQKVGG